MNQLVISCHNAMKKTLPFCRWSSCSQAKIKPIHNYLLKKRLLKSVTYFICFSKVFYYYNICQFCFILKKSQGVISYATLDIVYIVTKHFRAPTAWQPRMSHSGTRAPWPRFRRDHGAQTPVSHVRRMEQSGRLRWIQYKRDAEPEARERHSGGSQASCKQPKKCSLDRLKGCCQIDESRFTPLPQSPGVLLRENITFSPKGTPGIHVCGSLQPREILRALRDRSLYKYQIANIVLI